MTTGSGRSLGTAPAGAPSTTVQLGEAGRLACLRALEKKVLWLAVWIVHNANHVRPRRDGLKVGGHQASSASSVTVMTALYFDALRSADRVAVKPHASPVYHAIQYIFGRQTRDQIERFRAFGGAQSYPSRTKDADAVDFSTGSVGLGVAMTSFASLVQDYVRLKGFVDDSRAAGRMVALLGDAEFDEGNVFEALLEGWKHAVRNVWWIIDYNRQSLDAVIPDGLVQRMEAVFAALDWRVVTLKYGRLLERSFERRGGDALRQWLDDCPNSLYAALGCQPGGAWRRRLVQDLGDTGGIRELLDEHDDESLHRLMTNLGGHDLESILEAFEHANDDRPTCFVAYTVKGYRLPFAAHKDNHAGLMTADQVRELRSAFGIAEGEEWEPFAGVDIPVDEMQGFLASVPFNQPGERRHHPPQIAVPTQFEPPLVAEMSTQQGFARLLSEISRNHSELANRIVTVSADVTVSTSLGAWVNPRGIFDRREIEDVFRRERIVSPQHWAMSPRGQHVELGIAENNLFIMLAALGLSGPLFGARLLPIGTLYDPFISRGLDSLNYACYQDARFIVAATPSGVTLAPEGGAHQSIYTPLIGMAQPGLTAFEPAYVDELTEILRWSLEYMQADAGGAVYLRLSTRPIAQPTRALTGELRSQMTDGAYWLIPPSKDAELAIVCSGSVSPEAVAAHEVIREDIPGAGLLMVTSAGQLYRGWLNAQRDVSQNGVSHIDRLLAPLARGGALVTVIDAHPATLSWLGSVRQHRVVPLGVDRFGQSGDIPDLYRAYGLDVDAIVDAIARACVTSGR